MLCGVLYGHALYAETVKTLEQKIISQYYQDDFQGGRFEADQYNRQIADGIKKIISQQPNSSFRYDFKALRQKNMLRLFYSPDHKLKIYNLDTSSGGSMRFFENMIQYKVADKVQQQKLANIALLRRVGQTRLGEQVVYLLVDSAIHSSCEGDSTLRAYTLGEHGLTEAKVFKTQQQTLSKIAVPYNCKAFRPQDSFYQDYSKIYQEMIRFSADTQFIDIRILDKNLVPQDQYFRYQKQGDIFQYRGIVPSTTR
ncbi:hypothetical protein BFG52_05935 [Acinetobacter larvae]|uniref:Uncharacterized protein n=1 Tax=Acinetobacter larvae TaxID=1789224 RepID=A0A1B2LYD4_9GAMM|nr:hypothetical protein BFG52_05935 [Acinetobacter larvae]